MGGDSRLGTRENGLWGSSIREREPGSRAMGRDGRLRGCVGRNRGLGGWERRKLRGRTSESGSTVGTDWEEWLTVRNTERYLAVSIRERCLVIRISQQCLAVSVREQCLVVSVSEWCWVIGTME